LKQKVKHFQKCAREAQETQEQQEKYLQLVIKERDSLKELLVRHSQAFSFFSCEIITSCKTKQNKTKQNKTKQNKTNSFKNKSIVFFNDK
jgi:hypothetical protein